MSCSASEAESGLLLGTKEMGRLLERWRMDEAEVRRRMYRAPTPRERERWHAMWQLVQGWTATAVAQALDRDAHTIGQWATMFAEGGPKPESTDGMRGVRGKPMVRGTGKKLQSFDPDRLGLVWG